MDSDRFDALTRLLTSARSRRHTLSVLSGLAVGGLMSALGATPALAGLRTGGSPCARGTQCASGLCRNPKGCDCRQASCGCTCGCTQAHPECKGAANPCKQTACDVAAKRCATINTTNGTKCWSNGTCRNGTCKCTTGALNCGGNRCCQKNQACTSDRGCAACDASSKICAGAAQCGYINVEGQRVACGCFTSVDGATSCIAGFGVCQKCTHDADCDALAGAGKSVCLDVTACGGCHPDGSTLFDTICMIKGCFDPNTTAAGARAAAEPIRHFDLADRH